VLTIVGASAIVSPTIERYLIQRSRGTGPVKLQQPFGTIRRGANSVRLSWKMRATIPFADFPVVWCLPLVFKMRGLFCFQHRDAPQPARRIGTLSLAAVRPKDVVADATIVVCREIDFADHASLGAHSRHPVVRR